MNAALRTTLADVVELLEANRIDYALIGGLAASAIGQLRVTIDVDMVLATDVGGALALTEKLPETKFKPLISGVTEVVQQSFILPLAHCTTNVKVDLAIDSLALNNNSLDAHK